MKHPSLNNENGQMFLEYVLITAMAISIAVLVSSYLKQNEILGKLIASPWVQLSGMIQNGSWGDPKTTIAKHPNHHSNSASMVGDKVK